MLKLKSVSKYYYQDGVIASGITKVNLELHVGEFVVITGESGSGKSTLLNVLSGLDTYEEGEMYINGEETSHYTEDDFLEYRRKYVSNIFQNFNLVNSYTVYENIELTMLMNGKNRNEIKKYINELIEKVGLKKYRNTKVSKLSGGQKQRVAIARALANDTPIIVADEPTGALDSVSAKSILKLLADISKDKLVIVVTHNKKEIEEYATRIIKMHDGRLLENKEIKKINLDDTIVCKNVKNITIISKLRLGIRNTFNIPVKFLLMFIIFLLISITLLSNYAGFKEAENTESNTSYNQYFNNISDKRIIISKKDHRILNDSDYQKIAEVKGIDYLVKNDLINDYRLAINNNNNLYIDGSIIIDKGLNINVGRMPINDNEIVIKGHKDNYYLSEMKEEILNSTFNLEEYNIKAKVVGIIYNNTNTSDDYNFEFLVSDNLLDEINLKLYENYTSTRLILNDHYFNGLRDMDYLRIVTNENVPKGEIYFKDTLTFYCKKYNCSNEIIKINVKNIYYEDSKDLKITKIYNKNNSKKILNINYDNNENIIYMNKEDYNELYNKGNYQSSVFVSEIKDLEMVNKKIEDLGYNTLKLRDSKQDEMKTIKQVFKIFKLIVTAILIITLFFISYFIIKIIYKSRNSYYTTLRTLGSTKNVCISILRNELFNLATITYSLFILLIYLVKNDILKFNYIKNLSNYVNISDYIIVYVILLVLSISISHRYGRKIFKNSIIKTYGERI